MAMKNQNQHVKMPQIGGSMGYQPHQFNDNQPRLGKKKTNLFQNYQSTKGQFDNQYRNSYPSGEMDQYEEHLLLKQQVVERNRKLLYQSLKTKKRIDNSAPSHNEVQTQVTRSLASPSVNKSPKNIIKEIKEKGKQIY